MSEKKSESDNTAARQERRSGSDRRQADRRNPARIGDDKGILSTRKENRRLGSRRRQEGQPVARPEPETPKPERPDLG